MSARMAKHRAFPIGSKSAGLCRLQASRIGLCTKAGFRQLMRRSNLETASYRSFSLCRLRQDHPGEIAKVDEHDFQASLTNLPVSDGPIGKASFHPAFGPSCNVRRLNETMNDQLMRMTRTGIPKMLEALRALLNNTALRPCANASLTIHSHDDVHGPCDPGSPSLGLLS